MGEEKENTYLFSKDTEEQERQVGEFKPAKAGRFKTALAS